MCSRSKRFSALRRNSSGWLSSCLLESTQSHELTAANVKLTKAIQSAASQTVNVLSSAPEQPGSNILQKLTCLKLLKRSEKSSIKAGTCFLLEVLPVPVPMVLWLFVDFVGTPLEVCSLSNSCSISGSNTFRPATPWPSSPTLSDLCASINVRDYTSRPLEPLRGSCLKKGKWAELETRLSANPQGYLVQRGKIRKVLCAQKVLCFISIYCNTLQIDVNCNV